MSTDSSICIHGLYRQESWMKHTSSSPVTDLIPVFMSARGDEWVICKQPKPRRRRRPTDAASRRRRRRDIGSNRRVTGRRVGEIYRRSLSCTCKQAFCRREVKAKVAQPMAALLNQSRSHFWWWWSVRFVDGITLFLTRDLLQERVGDVFRLRLQFCWISEVITWW